MSGMKDRENAFENKFVHDAETQFKIESLRNRLLGQWAAQLMGKSGSEIEDYAREVIKADFAEPGDEDVFRKVHGDLNGRADQKTVRSKMAELLSEARDQITST
ncbi:hypothetical protein SAMN05444003_0494 [Cognatiyoonia sediminum]|uniref:DUF1476 domain-containing protein n=1 Tax=Cognatiyoonia sediminum TaxID=1508389 RepID=A0A1M5LV39_9RHOB|nr:DUF1476 domain-containing protein [Cognatiyoonia sediminum]SHG68917.1 hypothetical protein SAMN05444003_0494 [Cognatiyoonia sediminum]